MQRFMAIFHFWQNGTLIFVLGLYESLKPLVWHSPYISIVLYRVTLVQDPVLALHARTTPPRARRRARA
jgi:hypothetical protein